MSEPRNIANGFSDGEPLTAADIAAAAAELERRNPRLPRLTITRETSAEVRSSGAVLDVIAIIHPKLGAVGGVQTTIPRKRICRSNRLAVGCRLYVLEGLLELGDRNFVLTAYYVMGPDETFDDARAWMTEGFDATAG